MNWIVVIEKTTKLFFWFIASVVIPITTWFVLVRRDLAYAVKQGDENKQEIKAMRTENSEEKDKLGEKLDRIIFAVGEMKGELKRIRRE